MIKVKTFVEIFNSCKEAELPEPEITETFGGITTTLFIPPQKSLEKIIRLIKNDPKIPAEKITEKLRITSRAVEKQISRLKKRQSLSVNISVIFFN